MAQSVYVFESSDPAIRGVSLDRSGRNIPQDEQLSFWRAGAVFPMSAQHVPSYVPEPPGALRDLQVRGYHLFRMTARVLSLPRGQ